MESHHPSTLSFTMPERKEEGKQTENRPNGRQTKNVLQEYVLKEKAQKIKMTKHLENIFRFLTVSARMHGLGPPQWRPMQTLLQTV